MTIVHVPIELISNNLLPPLLDFKMVIDNFLLWTFLENIIETIKLKINACSLHLLSLFNGNIF